MDVKKEIKRYEGQKKVLPPVGLALLKALDKDKKD